MKSFFELREEKTQLTVGDYTTKHFDMCPSAVKLYSKIKDMTPMVHLVVENMMLHDLFFRLEKQAVAQGAIDDDDLEKADHYAEMIMNNAEQMGLEEEHSYIEDVHMAKFEELAGDGEEEDEDEDVNEKTLTPAELKKREEIARAIKRENPNMPMAKKMAIATASAKKVAESVEDLSSAGNRRLASIANNPNHPDSAAAKNELSRRRMKNEQAEQIDELSTDKKLAYGTAALASYHKQSKSKLTKILSGKDSSDETRKMSNRIKGINRATKNEEVELEESVTNLSHSRLKFHATQNVPHGSYSSKELKDEHRRRMRTEPDYVKAKAALGQ
jgi:hypothetical protein